VTATKYPSWWINADMFVPDSAIYLNQRASGGGLSYNRGKLSIEADGLFTDKEFCDASIG
jgi:hypothetical protein